MDKKIENVAPTTSPTIFDKLNILYTNISLLQDLRKVKNQGNKKAGKSRKSMSYDAVVKTLNLKFYIEQLATEYMTDMELDYYYKDLESRYNYMLNNSDVIEFPTGQEGQFDYLFDRLRDRIESFDKEFQVMYVVHDKDTVANDDDFFVLSKVKSHVHMVIKRRNNKAFRISSVLKKLGINFRYKIDNELWKHAVATCGNFASSVAYLTHETEQAQADGKTLYNREEIISNCSVSEVDDFREGYLIANESRKLTAQELAKLDKQFFDQGYALKDFDVLYNSLDFVKRSNSKMSTIKESYYRGIEDRLRKDEPKVNRVCLFIEGPPNTGKTYAINQALKQLGHSVYEVTGGGTGKFDKLSMSHTAITIDDEVCPNLLNMTDSRVTTAYRRNKDNPYWVGNVFVVTSNRSFLDWCSDSGLRVFDTYGQHLTIHGHAMITRFIVLRVMNFNGVNQIAMSLPDSNGVPGAGRFNHEGKIVPFVMTELRNLRGTEEERLEKIEIANQIINLANEIMKDYNPMVKNKEFSLDYKLFFNDQPFSIDELVLDYNKVFLPLWDSIHSSNSSPDFGEWLRDGAYNSYDKKRGFFRK